MKIEYVDDSVKFCDVKKGQVFIANGVVYMKTDEVNVNEKNNYSETFIYNAVTLKSGEFEYFKDLESVVVYPDAFLSV